MKHNEDITSISLSFKRQNHMFLIYIYISLALYGKMIVSRIEDTEPVLDLKDLFYDLKIINNDVLKTVEEPAHKAKHDNFKLLTDIQNVLVKCRHLTNKDKLLYCQSQRYFMKQYLRELNKR